MKKILIVLLDFAIGIVYGIVIAPYAIYYFGKMWRMKISVALKYDNT